MWIDRFGESGIVRLQNTGCCEEWLAPGSDRTRNKKWQMYNVESNIDFGNQCRYVCIFGNIFNVDI